MARKGTNKAVTDYWMKHYSSSGHCDICGNHGIIDSRGVKTPAGLSVGVLTWCLCPNGQIMRGLNILPRGVKHEEPYQANPEDFEEHKKKE